MTLTKADAEQLRGAELYSQDGDSIGRVDEVFFDRDTGAPEWLAVKWGRIGTKWTLIPIANTTVEGNEVRASYSTAQIEDAPGIAGREITDPEEDALYAHYGLPRSTAKSGSGLPGGRFPAETGGGPPASRKDHQRVSSSSGKKRAAYHVTPDERGWKTVKEGNDQPILTGRTKGEVVQRARKQAKKEEAQLIIHKKDGKIQEERTYGPDPVSSKG